MRYLIILALLLPALSLACPDGGSAPCRPGDHFSFEPGRGPSFTLSAPELDPGAGLSAVLLLAGTLVVIRGRKK